MESQAEPAMPRQPTEVEAELRKKLEQAIRQRDFNYKLMFLVAVSFESDDTGAEEDSKHFVDAMKEMFNLADVNIFRLVLPKDQDSDVYWGVAMRKVNRVWRSCMGRKLLLLHFACHGAVGGSNQFLLQGNPTGYAQEISWDSVRSYLFSLSRPQPFGEVDAACILDCCYSGAFVGPNVPSDKTVEVLAATDARSKTTGRRHRDIEITFTQRLIYEMKLMVYDKDKPPVTFPELFKRLQVRPRDPSKSPPAYRMLHGDTPILLPVVSLQLPPTPSTDTLNPLLLDSWRPKEHSVALKVHISTDINDKSTLTMIKWLHQLNKNFKIDVMGVNDINSTIVFLTVPYSNLHVLYRLEQSGLCKLDVFHENLYSRNLLDTCINSDDTEGAAIPTAG